MFRCGICGIRFDEPVSVHDNGWDGLPAYAQVDVCPACGANYRHFEEIEEENEEED